MSCVHILLLVIFGKNAKENSDMIQRNSIIYCNLRYIWHLHWNGKWHSYKEDASKLFLLCDVTRRVDGKFPNMRCMRFLLPRGSAQVSTGSMVIVLLRILRTENPLVLRKTQLNQNSSMSLPYTSLILTLNQNGC